MSLIYITGAPGTGKSTIQKLLATQGFEVHDLDDPEFGGPHNIMNNKRVSIPPAEKRSPDWFDNHEWRIDKIAIKKLKHRATNKDIYLCGVAESDIEILPLFEKIFYLAIDNEKLRLRLAQRTNNDYGKNEFELGEILKRNTKLRNRYEDTSAIIIDGSQAVVDIVQQITRSA